MCSIFDRWLKGVRNGIDGEPPVYIFVQNEGWRAEPSWPLERAVPARFYLAGANTLAREPGESGRDDYTADFTHDGTFGPPVDAAQISVADWPDYDLHPELSPQNRPDAEDNIVPTIGLHRGGADGSYLELPFIPDD